MMAALHRHILQQVGEVAADIGVQEHAASETDSPTFGLRVASLFIILAAGFLGGVPPLVMRNVFGGQTVGCIVRALAGKPCNGARSMPHAICSSNQPRQRSSSSCCICRT